MDVLVVGCGHPDRGDDAVGLLVAEAVHRAAPTVPVHQIADPVHLVGLLPGHDLVVVVDAATGTGPPGVTHVHEVGDTPLPVPASSATSTHGLSVSDAIELSRRVAGLPRRLLVVTVAGSRFTLGAAPQDAVRDAVAPAVRRVLALIAAGGPASLRTEVPGRAR